MIPSTDNLPLPSGGRVPPHNNEAEQSVLGSILLKEDTFGSVYEVISATDFYREGHRIIFEAITDLFNRNEPYDLVTVSNLLKDNNQLDAIGGPAYLASLTSIVPVASNLITYARIIRDKAILRKLITVSSDIACRCYEEQGTIEHLVDEAEQAIFELARKKSATVFSPLKDIIPDCFQKVEELSKRTEPITGVPTGYSELDRMTAGLQNSDLIILAGRPSMGKTALAMNIAQNAALVEKIGVAIFSLEMSKEQLTMRLLSSVGHIASQRIRIGKLHTEDWPRLTRAVNMLIDAPIYIDDTPALSIIDMRAKIRRIAAQYDIGLILVDYLQLMRGGSSENRVQEISEISRSLKALAKEQGVPVLALSQLNRSIENRQDKRPLMSDLRESGAIEQDADVICFIYRDEVYRRADENPQEGIAEIIVGKQRNGPTGTVQLFFNKEFTLFENLSTRDDPENYPE